MIYTAHNLEDTEKIARDFVLSLSPKETATVVGLYGTLGSGKTTFSQYLAKTLGVTEEVTSPTFIIEKIYELKDQKFARLVHLDAYRLEKSEELLHLGWKEVIADPANLVLIEWPEKVLDVMPPHIEVRLRTLDGELREIEVV